MSFQIERGLFKYDFIDYHAVLCVRVDADASEIRKRYLKIARRLHPDSCGAANDDEKRLASQLLSKLVNPAYENLYQDRNRAEHTAVLAQVGKRLAQDPSSVELTTDNARQLAATPNYDSAYKNAISQVSKIQYKTLKQSLEAIAQISELNLVYLMRSAGKSLKSPSATNATPASHTNTAVENHAAPAKPKEDPVFAGYLRRAQELIVKNQLSQARVELQDALKMKPNSSESHSLIGVVYMKQNQIKMAKIHFDRALQLNPKDETALEGKTKIDKFLKKTSPGAGKKSTVSAGASKSAKSESGGLFGGLFGGKKK
ncbi:DnaJ-class molecular chaperone with C-terminal Zn finger domain [Rivularia sp. PCC 7116]|uniref:J domain-containing protein n=1 Tax=Rivularia sp. PCC 7116 TaxID=373994 RepID=UPI00029EF728|nr:J domain-containing protein [Rivularia sp. PCC 7116]AFY56804.1 DnaJ-class molecular chaperone with C-terminal Zn finger domain [Rivularia sp. PCC 7116]